MVTVESGWDMTDTNSHPLSPKLFRVLFSLGVLQ